MTSNEAFKCDEAFARYEAAFSAAKALGDFGPTGRCTPEQGAAWDRVDAALAECEALVAGLRCGR